MQHSKADFAKEQFSQGYNCAQAVLSSAADDFGLPVELAYRLAAPFGGGMGRMGETCGAVTGAFMALGLKYGNTLPTDKDAKERAYQATVEFACRFHQRQGSILCRELLGVDIGDPQGLQQARQQDLFTARCPLVVYHAAQLLQEMLAEQS
ncbi:MAG: C-GCAxxG-C-C family protein [Chloroflexota bacterium]